MYTIEAIYDGTTFKPSKPIAVSEEYKVIITFVEPLQKKEAKCTDEASKSIKKIDLAMQDLLENGGFEYLGKDENGLAKFSDTPIKVNL